MNFQVRALSGAMIAVPAEILTRANIERMANGRQLAECRNGPGCTRRGTCPFVHLDGARGAAAAEAEAAVSDAPADAAALMVLVVRTTGERVSVPLTALVANPASEYLRVTTALQRDTAAPPPWRHECKGHPAHLQDSQCRFAHFAAVAAAAAAAVEPAVATRPSTRPVEPGTKYCIVCADDLDAVTAPRKRFVACGRHGHRTCGQCLAQFVLGTWGARATPGVVPQLTCIADGCDDERALRPGEVARLLVDSDNDDAIDAFLAAQQAARDAIALASATRRVDEILRMDRSRAEAAARALGLRAVAAAMRHSDAYCCPQCNYGPVELNGCSDLQSHHEVDAVGAGGISNACANCGFFAATIDQWRPWDGVVRLDEERLALPLRVRGRGRGGGRGRGAGRGAGGGRGRGGVADGEGVAAAALAVEAPADASAPSPAPAPVTSGAASQQRTRRHRYWRPRGRGAAAVAS
jgi:hypothetical protein